MEIEYLEAVPSDALKIINYLNVVAGQSDNLTFGLNECILNAVNQGNSRRS